MIVVHSCIYIRRLGCVSASKADYSSAVSHWLINQMLCHHMCVSLVRRQQLRSLPLLKRSRNSNICCSTLSWIYKDSTDHFLNLNRNVTFLIPALNVFCTILMTYLRVIVTTVCQLDPFRVLLQLKMTSQWLIQVYIFLSLKQNCPSSPTPSPHPPVSCLSSDGCVLPLGPFLVKLRRRNALWVRGFPFTLVTVKIDGARMDGNRSALPGGNGK